MYTWKININNIYYNKCVLIDAYETCIQPIG